MINVQLAAAYTGPPDWTLGRAFSDWQFEPVVVAITVLGTVGYLVGLARMRRDADGRDVAGVGNEGVAGDGASNGTDGAGTGAGGAGGGGRSRWPAGRTVAFLGGMALWVFVTCSGLGSYEKVLFTDRAVQSVLLLMVVPLLLAMGAPVTVVVEAAPERRREQLRGLMRGRIAQVLMFPVVSTVVLIVPPWLFYFSPWYGLSLTSTVWNTLFQLGFVLFGLAYFWPRLQIDPVGRHYHPLLGVAITVAEVIFDAALGFVLVFGKNILVPHYWEALNRPWGMSPRTDQSWGGAVLWGLGDIAGVPFLVALIIRVIREERVRTVQVDRELDERTAERQELQEKAGTGPVEPEEMMRPWWLDDPNLAHRYGAGEAD